MNQLHGRWEASKEGAGVCVWGVREGDAKGRGHIMNPMIQYRRGRGGGRGGGGGSHHESNVVNLVCCTEFN